MNKKHKFVTNVVNTFNGRKELSAENVGVSTYNIYRRNSSG
jgi:hypothetical protein